MSEISSLFALPSTGGDFILASHTPSSPWVRLDTREFGFALTSMIFTYSKAMM
jgi:hypothetical protein